MKSNALALPLALVALAPLARPDKVVLTDGSTLDEVTIVEEGLLEVTYRPEGKTSESTVPSEQILRIEFARKPKEVDEADAAIEDGNLGDGLAGLKAYVAESDENRSSRYKWAPAYARWRLVELHQSVGDSSGVVEFADQLLAKEQDSRYLPMAYLAKAQALGDLGEDAKAEQTLLALRGVIEDKGLPKRWQLECDLSLTLLDAKLTDEQKRDRVLEIGAEAGSDYPSVRDRARVAEGEAYLGSSQFDKALEVFRGITEDPTADDGTLAGAYTGIGDCLYQRAVTLIKAEQDAASVIEEGLLAFLHAASYKEQSAYRPKALLYAGRCFDLRETEDGRSRARTLYRAVVREYENSPWAEEAKKFL